MFASRVSLRPSDVVVRAAIVALTLATGYIHFTLGGPLFTMNAVGYLVAAIVIVAPLAIAVRFRWIVRVGLIGYAATAIVAWAVMGPYFTTAYVAKAIEIALIVLLAVDFARHDGNPIAVVRRELGTFVGLVTRRSRAAGAGA
jgi:CBS domain-containing protein